MDEQRIETKLAKKNKATSQGKKCKACDGDHGVEKCPIMLRGNKALKDQEEAGDEVNSMYLRSIRTTSIFFCSEASEWERITEAEKLSKAQLKQDFRRRDGASVSPRRWYYKTVERHVEA